MAHESSTPLTSPFVGRKGDRVTNGSHRVTIYNVATGEAAEVKGISAREAVASGYWSNEPVQVAAVEAVEEETEAKSDDKPEAKTTAAPKRPKR